VAKHLSNAQIDRLGDRLRRQEFDEADLRTLDEYKLTFEPAYNLVVERIYRVTCLSVTGRPSKLTSSIAEKLKRESIRLSQMQDIAGCRAVVDDMGEQDRTVEAIAGAFKDVTVLDRRLKPSHGYRAVHLVVREGGKTIEVQIRTALQHAWAEMCEKFAGLNDPAIKYGGGPESTRRALDVASGVIEEVEKLEADPAQADAARAAIAQGLRAGRNELLKAIQLLLDGPVKPG
jgi:ppGpp synthetase/RelA/SpoT-type nucleotidyltranferase